MSIRMNYEKILDLLGEDKERNLSDWIFICDISGNMMGGLIQIGTRATMFMMMDGQPCKQTTMATAINMAPGTLNKYLNQYYLPKGLVKSDRSHQYSVNLAGFRRWIQELLDEHNQESQESTPTVLPKIENSNLSLDFS